MKIIKVLLELIVSVILLVVFYSIIHTLPGGAGFALLFLAGGIFALVAWILIQFRLIK